ncbi:FHA domain-containing protein [Dyella sp. A6]|uniref:FHA domain-containing protein n=1 Tax=Dyella aluminiiresistens TaxID=3069105 RepID=UPI002E77A69B|nr:FHA domain-containing protein [Dyella sp. A6]
MRIEFTHSARESFSWTQARLRIGSAPDNDLILAADQASPHHLCIEQDSRGLVLRVLPPAGRIYVNARPVRERALLRVGDILSIGTCRMQLCADEDPAVRKLPAIAQRQRCTVALRAVAGPLSGRVWPLRERLELGPDGTVPLELPQGETGSMRISWRDDGQLVLDTGSQVSSRYPLYLNGCSLKRPLPLAPGDQLGLGMHRFVIDAPGMQPEPEIVLAEPVARKALPEDAAGPRGEVWWLIVTAALIALIIALLLVVRF